MDKIPTLQGAGCLICLVQASDSNAHHGLQRPGATKLGAALRVVDRLIDDLVQFLAEQQPEPPPIEVGVLAYSTNREGKPRLRPILNGSGSGVPLVPLHELTRPSTAPEDDGHVVWVETNPSGDAPARAALKFTRALLARWVAEHPGSVPPVIVHCTDGETSDGPIGDEVAALTEEISGGIIVHCLFRRGAAPSALDPVPRTSCGDYWAMSSPYLSDETAGNPAPEQRWLFVNKLSAARAIAQFVRRLWSRPALSLPETSPASLGEAAVEAIAEPAPEPAPDAEPVAETPVAEPAGPPRFELRALWTPKRGNVEKEWEDGFAAEPANGVLAVADGASDGIFTKVWVELLLKSFLEAPVPLDDLAVVEPWIQQQRRTWFEAIRYPEQRWSIQMKIDRSCGASTFLGFRLDPVTDEVDAPAAAIGWMAWVVGDVCLFHIRDGQMIASFPISGSAEFGITPQLYQSKAMRPTPPAAATRGELLPGDRIVFATDAMAQRLLAEVESGTPPVWDRFWDVNLETWRQEIEALRDRNAIVNDDCTLLVLRLPTPVADAPGESEPERFSEPPADETSVAADAVAFEMAPLAEPTVAVIEPQAEPEPIEPNGAESRPGEGETDPDDLPTEPYSSAEDGHDEQ